MASELYINDAYPFLSLQMNSFLRRIKNEQFEPAPASQPFLYQKPRLLCQSVAESYPTFWTDKKAFSQDWRKQISQVVSRLGLHIRTIENADTPAIIQFLNERYPPELANEICAFDLYRFKKFGHGVILEDEEGKVMGNVFEVGYHTSEMTSYTIRLAVDEAYKGNDLGHHIMVYSSLLAMESGSRVKRGLIQYENLVSLHVNLNKVGWICSGYEPSISGLGAFFEIVLPLDPRGLTSNIVDLEMVPGYLEQKTEGVDYRLIRVDKQKQIQELYQHTEFKVAALIKANILDEHTYFLALSPEELSLQNWINDY